MTEISAFSNRKSGFNENHSSENNNCTNNNCSITVYFCEDLPVTTKALAREIVKKSQIQQTSGKGIHEPVPQPKSDRWSESRETFRFARFKDPCLGEDLSSEDVNSSLDEFIK